MSALYLVAYNNGNIKSEVIEMDLKTAAEFNTSIDFVIQGMTDKMNEGLLYQTLILNSEDFNTTFDVLEKRLNHLYEKTRVLEDIIAYTKEYLEQTIYDTTKGCRAILDVIEDDRDAMKTSTYLTIAVPLLESNGPYTDRDGTMLPHSTINNAMVTSSGQTPISIPIKAVERRGKYMSHKSTVENIQANKSYRTYYLMDNQINGGLNEQLYIELASPTSINYLDIVTSNCTISSVQYITESGTVEFEDSNFKSLISKNRKIKAVLITLNSTLYKLISYQVDQNRVSADFWNKVKDLAYNSTIGVSSTYDFAELSGLKATKEAYALYEAQIAAWKANREIVAQYNRANGYADSVPLVEIAIKPDAVAKIEQATRSPFNADPYPTVEKLLRYSSDVESLTPVVPIATKTESISTVKELIASTDQAKIAAINNNALNKSGYSNDVITGEEI